MGLALVVYLLIYVLLIANLEKDADVLRAFCEQYAMVGSSSEELPAKSSAAGFIMTLQPGPGEGQSVFFIARPQETDAVCQGMISDGFVTEQRIVLKWF